MGGAELQEDEEAERLSATPLAPGAARTKPFMSGPRLARSRAQAVCSFCNSWLPSQGFQGVLKSSRSAFSPQPCY